MTRSHYSFTIKETIVIAYSGGTNLTTIFAHRGYSSDYPENTMAAFKAAETTGAEGIELDVQLTKDGVPVIIHDITLERTTTGKGMVRDHTYEELHTLSAGLWFDPTFEAERIPSLSEFIEWFQQTDLIVNIELKGPAFQRDQLLEAVMSQVVTAGILSRVILSSFDHHIVLQAKQKYPELQTAILVVSGLVNPVQYIRSIGVDMDFHYFYALMLPQEIGALVANGIKVRPYTVNDEQFIALSLQLGCNSIITDDPVLALQIRQSVEKG